MAEGFCRRRRGVGILEFGGSRAEDEVKGRGGCTGAKIKGQDGQGREGAGTFDEGGNEDGAGRDGGCCAGCDGGDVGEDIEGGQGTREVDALWFGGEET